VSGLFSTKPDLLIPRLILARVICQVFKGDLFALSPSVRKYRVRRDFIFANEVLSLLILKAGADVNAQGGRYGNALQAALVGGHKKIVALLLDKGADVNAQDGWYGNALQAASHKGHEKVVALLLDKGADVNAQGGWYDNALQAALGRSHVSPSENNIMRQFWDQRYPRIKSAVHIGKARSLSALQTLKGHSARSTRSPFRRTASWSRRARTTARSGSGTRRRGRRYRGSRVICAGSTRSPFRRTASWSRRARATARSGSRTRRRGRRSQRQQYSS
jgi:hypothetical protein